MPNNSSKNALGALRKKNGNGNNSNDAQKARVVRNAKEKAQQFVIPRPKMQPAVIEIVGVTSYIMHRWSEKALKMLEDSQTGKAKAPRSALNAEREGWAAAYVVPGKENRPHGTPGKYFIPGSAFKHAYLYGVSQLGDTKKFPKTNAVAWVWIKRDPIIKFEEVTIRTDTGRVKSGNPMMVYRPEFFDWSCDLYIEFDTNRLSPEQVVALFDLGGTGGIGDWRPTAPTNKSGDHGIFRVIRMRNPTKEE